MQLDYFNQKENNMQLSFKAEVEWIGSKLDFKLYYVLFVGDTKCCIWYGMRKVTEILHIVMYLENREWPDRLYMVYNYKVDEHR